MKTYTFADKNSTGILVVNAENEEDAREQFKDMVKDTYGWRLYSIRHEEEEKKEDQK